MKKIRWWVLGAIVTAAASAAIAGPMKKIRWWVLGAIVTAAASAAIVGPMLSGQPELPSMQQNTEAQAPETTPVSSMPSPFDALPPAVPSNRVQSLVLTFVPSFRPLRCVG